MADDELKRLFGSMREENAAAHVETRRQFDESVSRLSAENRHHFDVATEATKREIQLVAEAVGHVSEGLERTRVALEEEFERTARDTQAMIKFSHAELDRRVSALEQRQRTLEESSSDLEARVQRLESGTH